MKILIMALVILFLLTTVDGCKNAVQNNPVIVFPDTLVSFQNQVMPFIQQTCALQGCHNYTDPQANVVLADYQSIMNTYNAAMVKQYKPDNSLLVQMLENTIPHQPYLNFNVNDNQKKGIREWIKEGAKP